MSENPQVLEQATHSIRVSGANKFSDFSTFKDHFTDYIQEYKNFENYGRSLNNFAQVDNSSICYDGFKSLYSNHRNRSSAWFYIISNFGKIKEKGIHGNILGVMSNYIPSGDMFWTPDNIEFLQREDIQKHIVKYVSSIFGIREVEIAIDFMRDGVCRGSHSYRVYKVLSTVEDIHELMLEITYKETDPERRDFDFWLFIHFCQWRSKEFTLQKINEYSNRFSNADADGVILGMKESLLEGRITPIG